MQWIVWPAGCCRSVHVCWCRGWDCQTSHQLKAISSAQQPGVCATHHKHTPHGKLHTCMVIGTPSTLLSARLTGVSFHSCLLPAATFHKSTVLALPQFFTEAKPAGWQIRGGRQQVLTPMAAPSDGGSPGEGRQARRAGGQAGGRRASGHGGRRMCRHAGKQVVFRRYRRQRAPTLKVATGFADVAGIDAVTAWPQRGVHTCTERHKGVLSVPTT